MSRESKYLVLFGFYVGFWGMLQSLTVKLVPLDLAWMGLGTLAFSYGSFVHALTFPCTDAVAEIWGAKRARSMVYMGVVVYLFCTLMLFIGVQLPPAEGWENNEAYRVLFQGAPRIVAGSLVATMVAQLWDIYVFEWVKRKTGQRYLWLRNNASTFGSQLLDTSIFYVIAFYGVIPNEVLPKVILGSYLLKMLVAIVDTPMVYLIVRWITGSWTAKGDVESVC
ncbi:queuosine precursor transporter [Pelagicoccus sp. SDUM812003]|uniref:queuosine precursor transporter n=1 Tax=Pelagicoccus sp. SDUM812003 TaxID=3041267 RepID=UPI00280E2803|nr:queuosine precursor transporter [Pelagicoccus sp. SDUM812003]MDQ8205473.1 queuosine precursor transporter [Pelagicoccus sp. SDUM812003]